MTRPLMKLAEVACRIGAMAALFWQLSLPSQAQPMGRDCLDFETDGCVIGENKLICGTFREMTAARSDMTLQQLESMNCLKTDAPLIGTSNGNPVGGLRRFTIRTPDKVMTVWARDWDMQRRQ